MVELRQVPQRGFLQTPAGGQRGGGVEWASCMWRIDWVFTSFSQTGSCLRSPSWSLAKSPVVSLAWGGSCRAAVHRPGPGGKVGSFMRF